MARIVSEVRPRFVFVENSPLLVSRGLEVVLSDFAAMGYDARWGVIGGNHVRAQHKRERIWLLANSNSNRLEGRQEPTTQEGRFKYAERIASLPEMPTWPDVSNPGAFGSSDDNARRVDRTRCIGNAQIPAVAALAWRILSGD